MLSAPSHRPPRDTDIVLGRGLAIASRPGNKWLREFAEEHRDEYLQLKRTNKKEITRYIDSLVAEIYRCDRYFFRIVSNNYHIMKPNNYSIVSADEMSQYSHRIIHQKIQQLLNPSKEAAAAAAAVKKSKKNSSITSKHRTTSTAAIRDGDSSPTASLGTKSTKRKRRFSADDDEGKEVEKRAARKRYRYKCKADGCTNHAQKGGAYVRHGAKVKRCSIDGCTNQDKRRGVCTRHGANRNPYDESTVFSFDRSSFDDTTAPLPNNRAAAAIINQEGSRDPPSVIVCQVIDHVEV